MNPNKPRADKRLEGFSRPGVSPGDLPCGVILFDKGAGMSSHDAVDLVRRLSGIRRVGQCGTLDPLATGLLLLLVGKATRFFDLLAPLEKEYLVTMQFGARSTTGDVTGEILPVGGKAGGKVTETGLRTVLPGFTGMIKQRVPAYSAVKQQGVPLYRKARRGQKVIPPVREVQIHSIGLEGFDASRQQAVLTVRCSKGTYIRTLCEDIGEARGTSAYAAGLRRTAVGDLLVADAATTEELSGLPAGSLLSVNNSSFLSCLSALYFLPVRELSATETHAVGHGQAIAGNEQGPVCLVADGKLLAVYGPRGDEGVIRPMVVMR